VTQLETRDNSALHLYINVSRADHYPFGCAITFFMAGLPSCLHSKRDIQKDPIDDQYQLIDVNHHDLFHGEKYPPGNDSEVEFACTSGIL
jgi:hypothetical protein